MAKAASTLPGSRICTCRMVDTARWGNEAGDERIRRAPSLSIPPREGAFSQITAAQDWQGKRTLWGSPP